MTKKRSLGLTLLGWFEILIGIGGGGIFLLMVLFVLSYDSWREPYNLFSRLGYVGSYFFVLGLWPLLIFVAGIGILKLKCWAWKFNLFFISIIFSLIILLNLLQAYIPNLFSKDIFFIYKNLFIQDSFKISFWYYFLINIFFPLGWIFLPAFFVYYLTRPKVKAQFFKNIEDQSKEALTPKGAVQ